jgi:hypothetical protein
MGEQAGQPRNILPPTLAAPEATAPEASSIPNAAPVETTPAPEVAPMSQPAAEPPMLESSMGRFNSNASAVTVGELGTVEGPIAGTISGMDGLGDDAWARSDRTTIIGMLQGVPAASPSAAATLLLRKVLLTTAAPPPGRSDRSFNALRLSKLLDGGNVNDAADLATRVQAPTNPEILQLQGEAFIRAGRDFDACGDLTEFRLRSAERFWVQLRAFCYAVNRDLPALELTRSVISDQGLSDPSFLVLLDGLASGQAMAPETVTLPDALHLLMLARLNLPMNAEMAVSLGLADSLMVAASAPTPPALRIAAAEKALRAGALPTELFAQILELMVTTPVDPGTAPALARGEPLMPALARLRAALRITASTEQRAGLIHAAFEIGQDASLLRQVALLFVEDAAAIVPAPGWANWSDLFMRALLLAGRPDAAVRWFSILNMNPAAVADTSNQLQLILAFAAPAQADSLTTLALLRTLALAANPPPPAPPEPPLPVPDPLVPGQFLPPEPPPPPLPPPPPPSEAVVSHATLVLGLYDALARPLPMEAQEAVEPLMSKQSPGRRPPPALMQRIDRASLSGAHGEVALGVIAALGTQGARDLAPDVVVRLVRALQTAGIRDGAREVALEAFLLRPVVTIFPNGQAPQVAPVSGGG